MKQGQLKAHDYPEVYKGLGLNLATLGCVMLDLEPLENMHSIASEGHGDALYYAKDKARFWIDGWCADKTPHITLLYGLLQTAKNYKWHIDKAQGEMYRDDLIAGFKKLWVGKELKVKEKLNLGGDKK